MTDNLTTVDYCSQFIEQNTYKPFYGVKPTMPQVVAEAVKTVLAESGPTTAMRTLCALTSNIDGVEVTQLVDAAAEALYLQGQSVDDDGTGTVPEKRERKYDPCFYCKEQEPDHPGRHCPKKKEKDDLVSREDYTAMTVKAERLQKGIDALAHWVVKASPDNFMGDKTVLTYWAKKVAVTEDLPPLPILPPPEVVQLDVFGDKPRQLTPPEDSISFVNPFTDNIELGDAMDPEPMTRKKILELMHDDMFMIYKKYRDIVESSIDIVDLPQSPKMPSRKARDETGFTMKSKITGKKVTFTEIPVEETSFSDFQDITDSVSEVKRERIANFVDITDDIDALTREIKYGEMDARALMLSIQKESKDILKNKIIDKWPIVKALNNAFIHPIFGKEPLMSDADTTDQPTDKGNKQMQDKIKDDKSNLPGNRAARKKEIAKKISAVLEGKDDDIKLNAPTKKSARAAVFNKLDKDRKERQSAMDEHNIENWKYYSDERKLRVAYYWGRNYRNLTQDLKTKLESGTFGLDAKEFVEGIRDRRLPSGWLDANSFMSMCLQPTLRTISNSITQMIEISWHASRKSWNKISNILNNGSQINGTHGEATNEDDVDFIDSDVNLTVTGEVIGLAQADLLLYTNTTKNTLKWKNMRYSLQAIGASLLSPEIFWCAVQVLKVGTPAIVLLSGTKINSQVARMWGVKTFTLQTVLTIGIIATSPTFEDEGIIVPPGYQLFMSVFPVLPTGTAQIVVNANMQNANYRPFGPVEDVPIMLMHPNGKKEVRTAASYKALAQEMRTLYGAKVQLRKKGSRVAEDYELHQYDEYQVFIPIVGGMDNVVTVTADVGGIAKQPLEESKIPTVIKVKADVVEKTASKGITYAENKDLFDELKKSIDGGYDGFLSSTTSDLLSILRSWGTTQKPQSVITNQQASRIFNSWYEGCLARMYSYDVENDDVLTHENFQKSCPNVPFNPKCVISKPWATLGKAIQTGDTITISQFIRINTSLANGDAMNRSLLTSFPKYSSGQIGSTASVIAKMLLYLNNYIPLLGIENTYFGNSHLRLVPTTPGTLADTFPLSEAGSLPILAKFIDCNIFTALEAGMVQVAFPPAGWTLANIGRDVALIPLDYSMLNQPELIAAWTLAWLEYPYKRFLHSATLVDDKGILKEGDNTIVTNAANHRIPGIVEKVLYVVTNLFTPQNQNVEMQVGFGGGVIGLTTGVNGLNGVAVDIMPALSSLTDGGGFLQAMYNAMTIWHKFFGNTEDFNDALWIAATASYSIGWPAHMHARTGENFGYVGPTFPGSTEPDWNFIGLTPLTNQAQMDSVHSSASYPDVYNTLTLLQTQGGGVGIKFFGALDHISHVHKMWGYYDYSNPCTNFPGSIPAAISRMRFMARAITSIMDTIFANLGKDQSGLMCMGMLPNFTQVIARETWVKAYSILTQAFLLKVNGGDSGIKYRPDNYGLMINSYLDGIFEESPAVTSMYRKPLTERQYYVPLDIDHTWVMKKLALGYSVKRTVPTTVISGSQLEIVSSGTQIANREQWKTFRQLASTQWMQGPTKLTPRIILNMIMTNETATAYEDFHHKLVYPSCSIDIVWGLNFLEGPLADTVISLTDAPFLDLVPNWYIVLNQAMKMALNGSSPYFARWTRNSLTDYFMKILPDAETFATTQLGDSGEPDTKAALTAFGMDF